jgi:hypothetical protein
MLLPALAQSMGRSVWLFQLDDGDTGNHYRRVSHMDRRIDEWDYVVRNLYRSRQEVIAHPEWFEPDALQRIDETIASIEAVRLVAKAA